MRLGGRRAFAIKRHYSARRRCVTFCLEAIEDGALYSILARLFPRRGEIKDVGRIVLIRPCCIGDVVMATAALSALREVFPQAHITWAVGSWSAPAIAKHPALDAVLDTGEAALPWQSAGGLRGFVRQLRAGNYDLAVSLVRSPLMSLAVLLSGIQYAGWSWIASGRGFGYNLRANARSDQRIEHESAIYLRVIANIAGRPVRAFANLPVDSKAAKSVERRLAAAGIRPPYIVAHPGGGVNPGMMLASKRYPPDQLAALLDPVADVQAAQLILLGGPKDAQLVSTVSAHLRKPAISWVGELSFPEIAALAAGALCYIGNDSGLTHLAAAAGAPTVMLMGPTEPARYSPYTANHLALWKPIPLGEAPTCNWRRGSGWDWAAGRHSR